MSPHPQLGKHGQVAETVAAVSRAPNSTVVKRILVEMSLDSVF